MSLAKDLDGNTSTSSDNALLFFLTQSDSMVLIFMFFPQYYQSDRDYLKVRRISKARPPAESF